MKRRSLRSMAASRSISGRPATWLRKPSSAYSGMKEMPERPPRRESSTCPASVPMHETMPIPVTTTRRVPFMSLDRLRVFEQPHLRGGGLIDQFAVGAHLAVGHSQHQASIDHALDVDAVIDAFRLRQDLSGELQLREPGRAARAG